MFKGLTSAKSKFMPWVINFDNYFSKTQEFCAGVILVGTPALSPAGVSDLVRTPRCVLRPLYHEITKRGTG